MPFFELSIVHSQEQLTHYDNRDRTQEWQAAPRAASHWIDDLSKLKLSVELKSGGVTIPAGEYTIGAVKNGDDDFTLALYPGSIQRGTPADTSKLIKLDSMYLTSVGKAPHLLIDISPGWGKLEGRAVLTLHFGSLFLAGALT